MATSKNASMSQADINFVAEQLGIEMFYCRRDANTVRVGNQPKSASKVKFDRDRYNRLQVIAAAFTRLTGVAPIERQPADFAGFMARMGMSLETPTAVEQPTQPQQSDVPWDMNTPF